MACAILTPGWYPVEKFQAADEGPICPHDRTSASRQKHRDRPDTNTRLDDQARQVAAFEA